MAFYEDTEFERTFDGLKKCTCFLTHLSRAMLLELTTRTGAENYGQGKIDCVKQVMYQGEMEMVTGKLNLLPALMWSSHHRRVLLC